MAGRNQPTEAELADLVGRLRASGQLPHAPEPMPAAAASPAAATEPMQNVSDLVSGPGGMMGTAMPTAPLGGGGTIQPATPPAWRGFNYPGTPGARPATGMQQLIARGMNLLREHAPDIASLAPQLAARHEFRSGVRSEVKAGIAAGKTADEVKAGLADNISTFAAARKPKDAAGFNTRVTSRVNRRVDRMYARRKPPTTTGGTT